MFDSYNNEKEEKSIIDDDEPKVKYNLKKPFLTSKEVSFDSRIVKYESRDNIIK